MNTSPAPRKKQLRVPLLVVFCAMFVIIMVGYMWVDSIKSDISQIKVVVSDLSISSELLTREYRKLTNELAQSETDEYVIARARQYHGYMMPNELLFVVKNPEALGVPGIQTDLLVMEGTNE